MISYTYEAKFCHTTPVLCHWWEELIDNGHEFCDSPIILSRHHFQQPHCCVNTKLYHFLKLERKLLEVRACQALFLYNEYLQHRFSPASVCFKVVDDKSRVENFSFLCFTENLRGFKSLHSSLNQIVTRVTFKGVSAPSLLLILPFCIQPNHYLMLWLFCQFSPYINIFAFLIVLYLLRQM